MFPVMKKMYWYVGKKKAQTKMQLFYALLQFPNIHIHS